MKRLTGKFTLLATLVALFAALTVSASATEQGIRIQMGLNQYSSFTHWHGGYITIEKDGALVAEISLTQEDAENGLSVKEWSLTGEDYDPEAIYAVKYYKSDNQYVHTSCAVTVWVDGTSVYSYSYGPQKFLYTNCPHTSYHGRVCTFCGYECPCTYSERDHETDTCTLCGRSIPAEVIWGPSADELTSRGTWREMYMDNKNTGVVYAKLINDIRFDEDYDSGDAAAMNYSVPPESLYLDLNGRTFETTKLVVKGELTIDDSVGGGKMSSLFAAGSGLKWYYGLFQPFSYDGLSKIVINGGTFESANCIYSDWDYPGIVEINGGTFIAEGRGFFLKMARTVLHLNKAEIRYGSIQGAVVIGEEGAEVTFGDVVLVPTGNSTQDVWVACALGNTGKIDLRGWSDDIDGVRVLFDENYLATDIPLPAGYAYFDSDDTPVHSLEQNALQNAVYTVKQHPTHEVSFDANGAEGEMRSVNTFAGYALPEPAFTVPEGKIFYGWRIGSEIYQPGDMPELSADIVAVADWRYDTDFAWGLSAGDDSLGHGTWEEAFAAAAASEAMLYIQLNRNVSLTGAQAATTGVEGTTLDLNGCKLRLDSSVELSGLGLGVNDGLGGGKLVLETEDGLAPMFTANRGESTQPPTIAFDAAEYETNSYFVYSSTGADIYVMSLNDSVFTSTGPGFFYFGGAEDAALMTGTFHRPDSAATTNGAFVFNAAGDIVLSNLRFTGDWSDRAHLVIKGEANPGVSMMGELSGLTVLCEDADHPAEDHLPLPTGYAFFAGSAPSHVLKAGTVYTVGEYTTYCINFLPGDGSGKTTLIRTFTGYTLPDGDFFTPPEGKMFSGWLIGGEFYEAGDAVTLTSDIIATAQYVEDFDVYYGPNASELTGKGSLADAFAAFASSDGYIKLNRSFALTGGDAAVSAEYAGSGVVTLDLAGFDITVDKTVAVTGGGKLTVKDSVGRGALRLEAADAVTPMFRVIAVGEQVSTLYLMSGNFVTNGYFIRTSAEGASGCSNVWINGGEFTSTGSGGFYLTNADDYLYLGSLTFHASGQGVLANRAIYVDGESKLVLSSCTFSGTWSGAHIMLGSSGAPNLDLTKAGASIVGTKLATSVNTAATDIPLPRDYAFCNALARPVHLLGGGFSYEILSYPTYELRFDSNGGGSGGGMKTVYTFSGYVMPECAFTAPEGKSFGGWLVGTEVYQPGEAIELTRDASAMAQWKTPATLYFESNGGVGNNNEPLSGFVGDGIELPEPAFSSPHRNKFIGWEIDGIFYEVGDTYYFSGTEVTATAQYRETYCVWFGTKPYYVFVGESMAAPECNTDPPEEGYVFLGWVEIRNSDGTVYTVGQMYTPTGENVELEPKWGVTVSFAPNGGSGTMDAMNAGVGDPFYVVGCGFEPPEGKIFTNWVIEGGEVCYPDTTIVLDAPITLVAQWKTPVMVNFATPGEYGDVDVYDMREVFAEDGFVLPECEYPAPEGMVFSHWIIQGGDGTRYAAGAEVALSAGEVIFVAQWRDASFGAEWSVSGTTLNVTLGESAQTLVRRIIFAEYAANGQLSGVQIAVPEAGGVSFVRGAGEAKLFFLDENGVPVLAAQNVILE